MKSKRRPLHCFYTQYFKYTVKLQSIPHSPGQSKMVINHIEKLFVTNDAATILRELEVQHPAAKMIVMACQQQEQEVGDGTNFVMIFAGALLESAEMLIRMVRNYLFYTNVQ